MSRTYRGMSRHAQVARLSERRTVRRFMESLRWGRASARLVRMLGGAS